MKDNTKKIAVLYKSKYGTTRQYAEWIAQETGGTLYALPKVKLADLENCETVIIGGGIYAGSIIGMKFLTKNFAKLSGKKIITFSVGTSPNDPKNTDGIRARNFTPEMLDTISYFHLLGGLDYSTMSWAHKTMMKMVIGMLKKQEKDTLDANSREMIENYGKNVSYVVRGNIAPILKAAAKV